jgi:TPP-dependent pyruvate/acetoin dehydrogenase alpha subunit
MALSSKRSQSSALVVAVIAGKVARGTAWEQATEFAATNRLPVVFVVDCTQGSSPGKQDGRDMSHWPFPKIAVDGRDVIAVYRVTKEATTAARRGRGPTLVECVNFVAPGRRGKDERDPLASFRGYLKRHNVWSDESYAALEAALSREITGRQ